MTLGMRKERWKLTTIGVEAACLARPYTALAGLPK